MSPGPRTTSRRGLFELLRGRRSGAGHWVKVHRVAMACRFEVALDEEDARHVEDARAALDEVDAIESALSWFRDTSELSRVNREAVAGPVAVGPFLLELLALCRELHAATGGAFDPASTALLRCWGFLERRQCVVCFLGDNLSRSTDLESPVTLTKQRAALEFVRRRLAVCRSVSDTMRVRRELAQQAYVVAQCCAAQHDGRGARRAYVESLRSRPTMSAARGFAATYFSERTVRTVKTILRERRLPV